MANNFYRSIDVAFDRFEVKKIFKNVFFYFVNFYLLDIASSNMFSAIQVYVKNNIFKIPANVLLPEDKVRELCSEVHCITVM